MTDRIATTAAAESAAMEAWKKAWDLQRATRKAWEAAEAAYVAAEATWDAARAAADDEKEAIPR